MILSSQDVREYATGAAFLGTGGGGDPYVGSLLLKEAIAENGPISLSDIETVPHDALLISAAMIGAPTVMLEKIPGGQEAVHAVKTLEACLGQQAYAILPAEIGGMNALLPLVVAAELGLPVIDGDGMARAFPELQMVTFSIAGSPAAPLALADEFGNTVLIRANDDLASERLARSAVVALGGSAHMACYPMTGRQARQSVIRGTLSAALGLGRVIHRARATEGRAVQEVVDYVQGLDLYQGAQVLFEGKIANLERETTDGFAVGALDVEAIDPFNGALRVRFQNENLIALWNGEVRAIVPDLICIVDYDTAEPITTERLRYGQRVSVIGIGAPAVLRTDKALGVVGPQCFGLSSPYVPVGAANRFESQAKERKYS